MKEYKILITDKPAFRKIKKAPVDCYEWGGEYRPKTYAQLAFIPKKGFIARLTAYESEPKAVYKNNMDPVYTDSCLEFFARYKKGGYVNCEVNANGAILSAYGEGRGNRTPLDKLAGEFPKVRIYKRKDRWTAEIFVSLDIIKAVYGTCSFSENSVIYGNFYKCGDECEFAHYGSFAPVKTEKPDFHRPEFFAKMTLKNSY